MSWFAPRFACAGAIALVAAVSGCGFHLRGDVAFPFHSIYLNAPADNPAASEMRRLLAGAGGAKLADSATAAEVVLDLLPYPDDKQVLTLTGGGRVREYALAKRVGFRLHDGDGRDWLPAGEVTVRRTYSFNESEVLAREAQENRLLQEMQSDAVAQIVRRLQAAKKPA